MKETNEFKQACKNHFTGLSELFGEEVDVQAVLPFEYKDRAAKNIRLFDWFSMSEDERDIFYYAFGDIEEGHILGDFLQVDIEKTGVMSPRLRDGVVPFAYVVDDGAEKGDWQTEGLLMLDVRDEPSRVLIANVDGTIDGRNAWGEVLFDSLQIRPGSIPFEDE